MKITIGMIVLNEAQYIWRNLEQHYPLADQIIIVEGADCLYPAERLTAEGLSTDSTAELIRNFPDPDKKIQFIQHGWTSPDGAQAKCQLRNRYMEKITEPGLLVVVDGDEFYRRDEFPAILRFIASWPRHACWQMPTIHFWKQQEQFITGGYYDIPHTRFWSVVPGDKYDYNHNIVSRNGRGLDVNTRVLNRRIDNGVMVPPVCYHYGFCKSFDNMADKTDYYAKRGERRTRVKTTISRGLWFAPEDEPLPLNIRIHDYKGPVPEVFLIPTKKPLLTS